MHVGPADDPHTQIRKGAADLSQSAVDLTRRTGEQAATVEETAAALNEITQGVQRTAKLGDAVMNSISAAREHSERSNAIAADVVGAVEEIADSSNQIARINGVIRDIAFQTNLLALNAGVEAARAGEAGRGFAIVAQEVGALANRAAEAAKEINTLVESSKGSVEKGVELVTRSGQYVAEVIDKIGEVEKVAAAISRATAEQAATLGHVNQSVGRIDSATQQNAAMSENTQNSSASLSQNADALNEAIGRFKVGDRVAAIFTQNWLYGSRRHVLTGGALGGECDGMLAELRALPHQLLRWIRGEEYLHEFLAEHEKSPIRDWLERPESALIG